MDFNSRIRYFDEHIGNGISDISFMTQATLNFQFTKPPSSAPVEKGFFTLKILYKVVAPYRRQLVFVFLSLFLAAGMVLSLGWGLRYLIDAGFAEKNSTALDTILLLMGLSVILLAIASFGRSYFVGWVGERVVTDLRQQIFNHLLTLDVSFFESIRPGELVSRITADTTLIQIVIGTTAAIAVRNTLLCSWAVLQ